MSEARKKPFETLSGKQRNLLAVLVRENVDSVVVGGYAVRIHGYLRPTEDLDLLIDTGQKNLLRLRTALASLGADKLDHIIGHLSQAKRSLVQWRDTQFFSSVGGRMFHDVVKDAIQVAVEDASVLVISREQLAGIKRAAASDPDRGEKASQDLKDVRELTLIRRTDG